jgi:DNA-binding phage protein
MLSTATNHAAPSRQTWLEDQSEYTFKDASELCAFVASEIRRSRKKYTKIADGAGCCTSTVSNLANGTTHYPRLATVLEILRVLGFAMVVRP